MTESLTSHDLDALFQRNTTPFPALPLDLGLVHLPRQLPNPTQLDVYDLAKVASWSLICGAVPKLMRKFSIVFYLSVLHYASDGIETYRYQQSRMTREEWYAISDDFIHKGHDRALLYFYPLGHTERRPRFRPPARGRVEAWCRTALDAHLRRSLSKDEQSPSPGQIITEVRLPFVADLGPSGDEVIVWRVSGGLRAITLSIHRGEWGWYPACARPRRRVGSSCASNWSTDTAGQLSYELSRM